MFSSGAGGKNKEVGRYIELLLSNTGRYFKQINIFTFDVEYTKVYKEVYGDDPPCCSNSKINKMQDVHSITGQQWNSEQHHG